MPTLASLSDPKAYRNTPTPQTILSPGHSRQTTDILTYGTLLGSNLFQTFLAGPLAFKALPRPSFSTLQQAIFPPYFTFQSALPILLALTWPGDRIASAGSATVRKDAGFWGTLSENNLLDAGVPVAIMFATSFVNLVALGPMTTRIMRERKHQGMLASSFLLSTRTG